MFSRMIHCAPRPETMETLKLEATCVCVCVCVCVYTRLRYCS